MTSAKGDDADMEESLAAAETALRDLGYPYWTARAQLDRAEWFARQGRRDESARLVARQPATFEKLGAEPMLARGRALLEPEMVRKPGRR